MRPCPPSSPDFTARSQLRTLSDTHDRLDSDHTASLELIDHLQAEVAALRESASSAEASFAARERELVETAAKEKQQAAAAALQQGRELSQNELINKGVRLLLSLLLSRPFLLLDRALTSRPSRRTSSSARTTSSRSSPRSTTAP